MRNGRLLLIVTLATMTTTTAAATTFGELDAWCAPPDMGGRPVLCDDYLEAVIELLASPDDVMNRGNRVCVPASEDRAKVVGFLRTYALQHPASRDLDLVVGLGLALQGRFPCP